MSQFKDNFSKQSSVYAKYRPTYPAELFSYLSSLTHAHEQAWDCGTGNGQAAISLTANYKNVYATDPSEEQIKNAIAHNHVTYKVEKAEECSLPDNSADIITVAQALHWFNFDAFYAVVKRVLKKDGIFAAWAYGVPSINNEIDQHIHHFHDHVLDEFWQPENRLIEKEYTTIPFPFEEIKTPRFFIHAELGFSELIGMFNTWSATQRYKDKHNHNPVDELEKKLLDVWGNATLKKTVNWKIILKAGRVI